MAKLYSMKDRYCRLFMLLTIFIFLGAASVNAQKVLWETGYPKMSAETLGTYGDPVNLELKFSVSDAPLGNSEFKITLPAGIQFQQLTKESGDTSGSSYTETVSGQVVTVKPGGTINAGAVVDIKIHVTAEACNEADVTFNVDIFNNDTKITDASKQAKVLVRKPTVRILSSDPSQESTQFDVFKEFTLNIDVANGLKAKSVAVVLDKDDFTDLANFKFEGTDVSAKVTTEGNKTTITLDESILQGSLFGVGAKHLTFDAKSKIGSTRTIKVSGQYPAVEACTQIASLNLTLTNPTIPGTPNFELPGGAINRRWVLANDMDGENLHANKGVVMDGKTISFLRLQYQNTGTAGAIQVKNRMQAFRSQPYTYAYIVPDQIQYSIDGGTTKHLISTSDVVIKGTLVEANGYRQLKPGMAGKAIDAEVTINAYADAGKDIIIYWPMVQGDIYDNETYRPTISAGTAPYSSLQFMMYTLTATGGNGEAAAVPSNTYGNGGINLPKFMTSLSSQGLRPDEHEDSQLTFDVGTLSSADNQSIDLNIQLPSFVELDGAMEDAIMFPGVDITGRVQYTDQGNGLYRVRFISNPTQPDPATGNPVATAIVNLDFRYKVKAGECTGVNKAGEIEYWIDYNLGDGTNPLRPQLRKIAKIYQPLLLFCEKNGIEMKEFELYRITRGLQDSNENFVPDNGQPALDAEMNHKLYLKNDEGKIHLKGLTLGAFQNMYLLLTTDFKLKDNVLKIGQPTIQVNGGTVENISLTHVSSDSLFYIEYNKPLPANAEVTLDIPFKVTVANNLSKAFDVELYVSNTKQTDPFHPVDRVGEDKTGRTMIAYAEAFATDKSNETFANNDVRANVTLPFFDNYHGNNFYEPFFKNEVRRLAKPLTYEFELPAGFLLKSDLTVTNVKRRDQHLKDNPTQKLPVKETKELANGNTLYIFDFASLFQNDVNDQATADGLPATKWMHPDDAFYFNFLADIQATKGAAITTKVQATTTFLDAVEGDSLMKRTKEFNMAYTGDRTTLDIVPNTIKAQEKTIHIPVATVGNPNAYNSEMWIYVEGDVRNVSATPTQGGTKIVGQGIEGRWVYLGALAPRTAPNYSIDFEGMNPICDSTTIRVYTVSRFQDAGWTPDMSKPVDPTDIDHIAANKPVYLLPTLATVQAAMTTSTNELEFEKAYTLTATIDSKASESALVDPQMVVSVPAGQRYTAGTAKVEYPVGTFTAVSPEVEAKLIEVLATDATQGTTRDYTMIAKDLIGSNVLHGFGDNTITDNDRVVSLVLEFKSMCETPLTGIRFEGAPSGNNLCGILANGSEKRERSVEMFSTLDAEYEFSVNAAIVSGNRAFNEIRKEDKLKVDVTKSKGIDALMANDVVAIHLPKYLNVKDGANIVINSTDIAQLDGTNATVVSNSEVENTRVITIQLPVDAINASSADHGLGKGLSFTLDVVYTPNREDAELVSNPEQTIKVIVTTNKQFSPSCPDAPLAIGSANLDVALVTASENPYKGEVGTPLTLEIISSEYAGEWFDVEIGGTALSSEATYTFTPADASDKTFYVSSVFNGVDYGRVPVLVSSVPILDFTVVNPDPLCVDSELDLATLVSGYAEGVTIKYYADAALTTEITNPKVIVKAKTSYFAVATSGTMVSAPKEIVVDVLAPTTITTQPVATTVDFDGTITLSVVATGGNLTYQWQKDGADITGATDASYTQANAEEGDSGEYTVIVTGDCGSITSTAVQVTVYPALDVTVDKPAPICENESIDLSQFVTAPAGATVKYYTDAEGKNELTSTSVKPSASTTYYAQAVNAGGTKGALVAIDVEVIPATAITSQPAAIVINYNGTITLSVIAKGENLTYQWQKDGVDIVGATTATYSKANADENDKGQYSVIVSGDCGSVTSANAQVTVYPTLEIVVSTPAPICTDESIDLSKFVTAQAGANLKYYSDAQGQNELASATVKPSASTTYYVKATNAGGTEGTLEPIDVTVLIATALSTQPVASNVNFDGTITLSVVATGENLIYQWQKDGADIAGATGASYTKANATETESGVYSVAVSGDCGTIASAEAKVVVYPSLDVTVTKPAAICADESIDLSQFVTAKAGATVKYYSDAQGKNEIASTTVKPSASTTYYVKAVNAGGAEGTLKPVDVTVLAKTAITTQPVASKVNFDGTITLSVVATGENLTYQWQKDGVNIAGATAATYSKASAKDGDSGVYVVIVSGDCGSITSANAQVTVYPSLELIVTKPAPICQNETIDLAQFVTAKPGITVKYYSDAQGKNELANRNVKPTASTIYYVRGVNAAGVQGTLYKIVVDVNPLPEAKIVSSSDIVCANTEGEITLNLTGTAPWNIVYSDGTKDYTLTATTSSYTFKVPVAQETTYSLKSVTDALACGEGKVSGSTTIKVEEPVVIIKQPTSVAFCNGDGFTLEVEASGAVDYQWYKDGVALNGENGANLYVSQAAKADNGEYYVEVIGNCGSIASNKVKVQVNLSDIIVQKWNNTLVANNNSSTNGGYNFVSYKWFKEGVQIDKGPYHTVGNNPNDMLDMGAAYTLEVTTDKGEVFMTCPFYPSLKHASVRLYPNPAKVGEPVYIEVTTEDGATPNGTVDMYTLGGVTLTPKKVTEKVTQVSFSTPGVYIVKYKAGEFNQDFKVIVK